MSNEINITIRDTKEETRIILLFRKLPEKVKQKILNMIIKKE